MLLLALKNKPKQNTVDQMCDKYICRWKEFPINTYSSLF